MATVCPRKTDQSLALIPIPLWVVGCSNEDARGRSGLVGRTSSFPSTSSATSSGKAGSPPVLGSILVPRLLGRALDELARQSLDAREPSASLLFQAGHDDLFDFRRDFQLGNRLGRRRRALEMSGQVIGNRLHLENKQRAPTAKSHQCRQQLVRRIGAPRPYGITVEHWCQLGARLSHTKKNHELSNET